MAASIDAESWRDTLNNRQICKVLKEHNGKECSSKYHSESKNILCIYGSDLYVWDYSNKQVLHTNLKQGIDVGGETEQSQNQQTNNGNNANSFQRLSPSSGVQFDVDNISANRCGTHLVLWSAKGIHVLELPRRWGRNAMYEGGKDTVLCRSFSIGERTFSSSHSGRVRQVTWHPGSRTDSHLAVLTADTFRVYDIHNKTEPLTVVNVNTGELCPSYSPSKTLVSSALGEIAVAFDFGRPLTLKPKSRPRGSGGYEPVEVWPVYCVRGSGDVMVLYSHLSNFKQLQFPVQGPLTMYPPAEDNYGVDACSILCLDTPIPVLVISTCEGRVHHCVQMPSEVDDGDHSTLETTADLNVSKNASIVESFYEPLPERGLFVIETAELDLCLFPSGTNFRLSQDEEEEDFMCPIRLKKDPCSHDRYHCSHSAGVHSVAMPWLSTIQQFFLEDSEEDLMLSEEKQCVVEHLLCTKPLHSCPLAPVLGMDLVSDPMLGPTLVILASDYNMTALPISLQYQTSKGDDASGDSARSSTQKPSREPFSQRVAHILQRKASIPLLKSGGVELSQQECFQMLSRTTQILKEEYITKQDLARQELDTRTKVLAQHKEHQLQDLQHLCDSRLQLRDHASAIAEKLESNKETHEELVKRLDSIMRKIQNRVPVLSQAEKHMARQLAKIKDNTQLYQQNIEQVRTKQQYQASQVMKVELRPESTIKENQLMQIKGILQEENAEIEELKRDISRLSIEIT